MPRLLLLLLPILLLLETPLRAQGHDKAVQDLSGFASRSLREQKPELAVLCLREAARLAPSDARIQVDLNRARNEARKKGPVDRIQLLKGALAAKDSGALYAAKAILVELKRQDPTDSNAQKLLTKIESRIADRDWAGSSPEAQADPATTTPRSPTKRSVSTTTKSASRSTPSTPRRQSAPSPPTVGNNRSALEQHLNSDQLGYPSHVSYADKHVIPAIPNSHLEREELALIREWRDSIVIDKIVHSGKHRLVRIDGTAYSVGDLVLPELYVYLHSINVENQTVYFNDRRGNIYRKRVQ